MFDFTLFEVSAKSKGVLVTERPSIPAPERNIDTYEVPGRDGSLTVDNDTFSSIEIPINCNFMADKPDEYGSKWREIKAWLLQGGLTTLIFSDDEQAFYKVHRVTVSDPKRTSKRIGSFSITCMCSPFTYLTAGQEKQVLPASLDNLYYKSEPVYVLIGEGMFTLTVNGNSFTINVAQNAIVDVENRLIYRDDGTLVNQMSQGNIEGLILVQGSNSIELSAPEGGTAYVYPNWRSL